MHPPFRDPTPGPHGTPASPDARPTPPVTAAVNEFAEKAEEFKEQAADDAKELVDAFQQKKDHAMEQLQKAKRSATMYARENPWPLIAGAAALGVFVGLLLGSCSHHKSCTKRWE